MKVKPQDIFLPLVVLAFVGLTVTFLTPIFTTTNRWLLLALFAAYLFFRRKLFSILGMGIVFLSILYCLWGITTTLWSERMQLSLYKSLAALFVTICTLAGGYLWSKEHGIEKVLDLLLPLALVALTAGVLGRFSADAYINTGSNKLYQGLVNGSNMFGTMLAMCTPLLLWKIRWFWNSKWRWLWVLAGLTGLFYLFLATSRGAIMIMLVTVAVFFTGEPMVKRLRFAVFVVLGVALVFMLVPNAYQKFERQFIYKQTRVYGGKKGVLYTREYVWRESWTQAKKGGIFGGGYGVTIGSKRKFTGGLTAVGYGREKGNSQLAIMEEVGVVGFVIYVALLGSLLAKLLVAAYRWPHSRERQVLLLVSGSLLGMTVHSFFEAWWVAPGSPEYVYFWSMAGVGLGLLTHTPIPYRRKIPLPRLRDAVEPGWTPGAGVLPSP